MPHQIQSILHKINRKPGDKLNIITFPSDDHYDTSLAATGHDFWAVTMPGAKTWLPYYPKPRNYHLIPIVDGNKAILPTYVTYDLIIVHNRAQHYDLARNLGVEYDIPVILVDHDLPPADWKEGRLFPLRVREGDANVFIGDSQKAAWGFHKDYDAVVNHVGIDSKIFTPIENATREDIILWLADNVNNKEDFNGFQIMRYITGYPMPISRVRIVGNNPGLSRAPETQQDLIKHYNTAGLYLNTRLNNPLPCSVLEAMACGCPVVSFAIGDLPSLLTNGETGFTSKNPDELRGYCASLLSDKALRARIGANGRELVKRKFGITRFVKNWQHIINKVLEENK